METKNKIKRLSQKKKILEAQKNIEKEKAAFLFTAQKNASKIFTKYL